MNIDPIRDGESLMSIADIAKLAGVSKSTVRLWIKKGIRNNRGELVRLHTIKVGVVFRTSPKAYRHFVRRMSVKTLEDL